MLRRLFSAYQSWLHRRRLKALEQVKEQIKKLEADFISNGRSIRDQRERTKHQVNFLYAYRDLAEERNYLAGLLRVPAVEPKHHYSW